MSAATLHAQTPRIDSLKALLQTPLHDTARVNLLNDIAVELLDIAPQQGERYARQSLALAQKCGFRRGEAMAHSRLGTLLTLQVRLDEAFLEHRTALNQLEALGDKYRMGPSLNGMGLIAENKGRYNEALDWHFKMLRLGEEMQDTQRIIMSFQNIGVDYQQQKNFEKAIFF